MNKKEFIKNIGINCPDCDNSGTRIGGNEITGPEAEQCRYCYVEPLSIFNLSRNLDTLLKEVAEQQRINDWENWRPGYPYKFHESSLVTH